MVLLSNMIPEKHGTTVVCLCESQEIIQNFISLSFITMISSDIISINTFHTALTRATCPPGCLDFILPKCLNTREDIRNVRDEEKSSIIFI